MVHQPFSTTALISALRNKAPVSYEASPMPADGTPKRAASTASLTLSPATAGKGFFLRPALQWCF